MARLHAYGVTTTVAVLLGATALLALYISASRSVRAVPRPRDWTRAAEPVGVGAPA